MPPIYPRLLHRAVVVLNAGALFGLGAFLPAILDSGAASGLVYHTAVSFAVGAAAAALALGLAFLCLYLWPAAAAGHRPAVLRTVAVLFLVNEATAHGAGGAFVTGLVLVGAAAEDF